MIQKQTKTKKITTKKPSKKKVPIVEKKKTRSIKKSPTNKGKLKEAILAVKKKSISIVDKTGKAEKKIEKIYKYHVFIEKSNRAVVMSLVGILCITIAGVVFGGGVVSSKAENAVVVSSDLVIPPESAPKAENVKEAKKAPLLEGVDLEKITFSKKVPILMYHYVEPMQPTFDDVRKGLTVTPENFRAQMKWLHDNGFKTLTLSQYFQKVVNNDDLPQRPIIITFDDGYKTVYDNALPVLREYEQTAVLFIITEAVGPVYMNWDEIKQADKWGFEIGSHTLSHPRLTDFSNAGLQKELQDSKNHLEQELGKPTNFFCYPYGLFDARVHDMVRTTGYKGAVTTGAGFIVSNGAIFEMPRIRIPGNMAEDGFIWTMNNILQQ